MAGPRIGLLTGPVGVGKTTVAARVVELARRRGIACRGVLAPALHDDAGRKVGIAGLDLATAERRTLARIDRELGGPRLGPYSFDAAALEWATGVVLGALRGSLSVIPTSGGEGLAAEAEPALVVVDEIGKLELWYGQGLAPVLPALAAPTAAHVLVIVRESLLDELQARLGDAGRAILWAGEENREQLPAEIAATFL